MPQVMRPKKGFASGVIVSTRTVKDPSKNYSVGRTSANEFFLLSLSLSLVSQFIYPPRFNYARKLRFRYVR